MVLDLRPPGDAGLHAVPQAVVRDLPVELFHEKRNVGPRTDEAHIPLEHVYELRYLVDTRLPQERTDLRYAVLAAQGPLVLTRSVALASYS